MGEHGGEPGIGGREAESGGEALRVGDAREDEVVHLAHRVRGNAEAGRFVAGPVADAELAVALLCAEENDHVAPLVRADMGGVEKLEEVARARGGKGREVDTGGGVVHPLGKAGAIGVHAPPGEKAVGVGGFHTQMRPQRGAEDGRRASRALPVLHGGDEHHVARGRAKSGRCGRGIHAQAPLPEHDAALRKALLCRTVCRIPPTTGHSPHRRQNICRKVLRCRTKPQAKEKH